jgi:pilus assembly protein CpaB
MKRKIGFAVAGVMATFGALLVFLYLKDNRSTSTAQPAPAADVGAVGDLAVAEPAPSQSGDGDGNGDNGDNVDPLSLDPVTETGSLTAVTATNEIIEFGDPVVVPPDYLQVTFSMSTDRALGGRVRPGDTVAVIASFNESLPTADGQGEETVQTTDVLLHKALVADVQVQDVLGATTSSASIAVEVPEGALNATNSQVYTITIAVPATQVERLVYALEYGSVWLAYQGAEAGETTNGIVTSDNIHQEVSIFIDRDDLSALTGDAPADLAFGSDPAADAPAEDAPAAEGEG